MTGNGFTPQPFVRYSSLDSLGAGGVLDDSPSFSFLFPFFFFHSEILLSLSLSLSLSFFSFSLSLFLSFFEIRSKDGNVVALFNGEIYNYRFLPSLNSLPSPLSFPSTSPSCFPFSFSLFLLSHLPSEILGTLVLMENV